MRKLSFALVAALLAGVGTFAPAAAPAAVAATNPKVAIIVGAVQGLTANYRSYGDQVYAEALKYTNNVVRVYSPKATWAAVKSAVNGASIVVYMGHGNGWPAPYPYDSRYTTRDGFGINYDTNGDGKLTDYDLKYYGEPSIATLTPAPNAVVLLFHLCYAGGSSEPGLAGPTLDVARQRVDNYASAFLKAGARAVIADGHNHSGYITRLFTTRQTVDQLWRTMPNANGHLVSFASVRSPGYTNRLDPDNATSGYYRAMTGSSTLTTVDVTGAGYASTAGDPSTFAVPGNASPVADGQPVFGTVDSAVAGANPVATVAAGDKVRIDARETATAADGSPIFRMHTDAGIAGWMAGSALVPRDSQAPRVWTVDDGTGAFSPNGDGSQDTFPLSVRLSETATWTIRILDPGGATLATGSGTGSTATLTWGPAAGSVADGTYAWSLNATDAWGNGPLAEDGPIVVDTQAPDVSAAAAMAASVPQLTPNGDGVTDTIRLVVGSTEPGTVVGTAVDASGTPVASFGTIVGTTGGTVTWDGRTSSGGYAPDGRYAVNVVARDQAGNTSAPQIREVDLYGALGFVRSSTSLFFPQDRDTLARTAVLSFVLRSPATVDWSVVSAGGVIVRTIKTAQALPAGTYKFSWDGRNNAGAFVPRGIYYSTVTASNGTQVATQRASVTANAFRVVVSDRTPGRRQRITVTAPTADALSRLPRVWVIQPGVTSWAVTLSRVSGGVYRATVTLKASSRTGTLKLKVYGYDSAGRYQYTYVSLPIH